MKLLALAAAGVLCAAVTPAQASLYFDSNGMLRSAETSEDRGTARRVSRSEARRQARRHASQERRARTSQARRGSRDEQYASYYTSPPSSSYSYSNTYSGGLGPRPRRWCGWWMRSQRGGGPHLNVAWNWSRWGSPTSPQVGAVVVWRHHVGEIVGQAPNGRWLVRSGNDGNAVRTRARSVSGAVFRI